MNKEQIYDTKIAPLMKQIIEICRNGGIAMLADFAIPTYEDEDLRVTTCTVDENTDRDPLHQRALLALQVIEHHSVIRITAEHADGRKQITDILP